MVKKDILISPSGQMYGSENVLFGFLEGSSKLYEIYAPKDSVFYKKLKNGNYSVKGFGNLKWLYLKLFIRLLFFKRSLYLNEAGHISYVKLLAYLLPFRKFVVSVRLLEDCNFKLRKIPKNITLIPVSYYIGNQIITNSKMEIVYDAYKLSNTNFSYKEDGEYDKQFTIGIIGRVVETKGLNDLIEILKQFETEVKNPVIVTFYGDYNPTSNWFINFKMKLESIKGFKYEFVGFKESQSEIYIGCDLIIHLNKIEALGRIIFESIDYETPFLCYNAGGSGELAKLLGFSENTIEPGPNSANLFKEKILKVINNKEHYDFNSAKEIMEQNFNYSRYSTEIEKHL